MACEKSPIEKKILHAGTKNVPFTEGTKVNFHFQTKRINVKTDERTLIDDSKKLGDGKPMELILGKKFKFEAWEAMVKLMALNEVAQFTVDKSLVHQYPIVSKTLRDIALKKEQRTHNCAQIFQHEGLGYDDLNELLKSPSDLEFILELVDVKQPGEYEKENWQISEEERLFLLPKLRQQGNECFQNKNYYQALKHYTQAIGFLEQLQLKEKPHDTEWNELAKLQVPFLLNYAQCKLLVNDYYDAIEQCTKVLAIEPDNVKAYFRRAKGHVGAWNPTKAREDFRKALSLDPSLQLVVKEQLDHLDTLLAEKDKREQKNFKKIFQ